MTSTHIGARPLGAVALVLALAGSATACSGSQEDGDHTVITAAFNDVSPMVAGNVVKASGVKVGTIEQIRLVDGVAHVEMKVDRAVLPLNRDATATVITQDLLGERFIELDRGTPSAEDLERGDLIDLEHTRRVVDLDEVLNAVDDPTGTALAALLSTLGEGLAGNGQQAAAALHRLAPAMRDVTGFARVLREQNSLLSQLVSDVTPVAEAVAGRRGAELDRLVATSTSTLDTVAENREALAKALAELPGTLIQARRSLAQIAGVSDTTAATLQGLRPLTDDLSDVSRELEAYAEVADPALASLRPVLERGEQLIDEATPLVEALSPAAGEVRSTFRSGRTLVDQAVSKRLTHLMEFVKGWSLATTDYDAISHYFKAIVPVSPKVLGQVGVGPLPGATSPVPNLPLPGPPQVPLPGRDGSGPSLLDLPVLGGSKASGTGLTVEQENSMLDQLLGGLK